MWRSTHLFNLEPAELRAQVIEPWWRGGPLVVAEKEWLVKDTRITILEGPVLEAAELGMGQGWNAATRAGTDVTARMMARPQGEAPAAAGRAGLDPSPPTARRVAVGGGPGRRTLDTLAGFLFALGLEPVPWRVPGVAPAGRVVIVALGADPDGTPDPAALMLAGAAAATAPGRTLVLEAGARLPEEAAAGIATASLDAADVAARIAEWLEAAGCPVQREDGWDDPSRFAG
jgi:hypothetical protein